MSRNKLTSAAQGERFAQLRVAAGLSQKQVAEEMGLHKVTVSHWELGYCFPVPSRLLKLAELYGVAVDELLMADQTA